MNGRPFKTLRPDRTVCEAVNPLDLAELSVPEPFDGLSGACAGSALVAHLCGHTVLRRKFGQESRLIDGEGERLLDIDVLPGRHRLGCDDGVGVVGGGDHHGVGLVEHLVEHHTVVIVLLCLRVLVEHVVGVFPVHVAETDDVFGLHLCEVGGSASSDADTEDVQLVARGDFLFLFLLRCLLTRDDDVRCYRKSRGHGCSCLQKGTPRHVFAHFSVCVYVFNIKSAPMFFQISNLDIK